MNYPKNIFSGTRIRREWMTPSGKNKFQVREILEVGQFINFKNQKNDDSCKYIVLDGPMKGNIGHCTRASLAHWIILTK